MDIKKLLTGGIIAGVLFFLLGWLVYGNLIMGFMHHNPGSKGHLDRKDVLFVYLITGNLFQGFLLAFIFVKANVNSLADGLVTGAVVGLLMVAGVDIIIYGTSLVLSKKGMAADIIAFTIISAVTGAVLGIVLGKNKN